jgi:predicted ATPase/DNA-binding CsgD family transcriptional regulator
VFGAAAGLCAELLEACDELRVLATSREALRIGGEAGYRLGPLAVPGPDDPADAAGAEAVALFVDRARRADAHFALDSQTGPDVARLVRRLDGMPLAIELAAARTEALGVSGLLARLDDRFTLLTGGDRLAPPRQRSLAATVQWSYQLLDEPERRAFRTVSLFPGPFTLEGAEAVSGSGAALAVLRLVDCSLLVPPRTGVDGRPRYVMLDTLRAYGAQLRAEAGEQDAAAAALARYALRTAEQAAADRETGTGEAGAVRLLDAEDTVLGSVLAWAMGHDTAIAQRLAVALGWWWLLRGRLTGQYRLLQELAGRAEPESDEWCAVQLFLGVAAYMSGDLPRSLGHLTAVRDAMGDRKPSRVLADALAFRAGVLLNTGRRAEGAEDIRRSQVIAQELGYPIGEFQALRQLGLAALLDGDYDRAVELIRQQQQLTADIPPSLHLRASPVLIQALTETGDLATAESACAATLAQCREYGDLQSLPYQLMLMADLQIRAGRFQHAAAQLREGLQAAMRTGYRFDIQNGLWYCALLCTATGRYAEAATIFAAQAVHKFAEPPSDAGKREEALSKARRALGPAPLRAAEERGTAMSLDTAAEYALMLTAPAPPPTDTAAAPGLAKLSARERELVTLVAQGRTNAQIAAQLYISVRTVGSHLDRIRDKTGCRRRADLTRLALTAGLV